MAGDSSPWQHSDMLWLMALLGIIIVGKMIPTKKTGREAFEPASDKVDATLRQMNPETVPERLSIPLSDAVNVIKFEARFNIIYKLILFALPLISFLLIGVGMDQQNDDVKTAGSIAFFLWPLLSCIALLNWWRAKRRITQWVGTEVPAFTVDPEGLTVPLLLIDGATIARQVGKQGARELRLRWQDIDSWTVYSDRSYLTVRLHAQAVYQYRLVLKDTAPVTGMRLLCIKRPFSGDEERKILAIVAKGLGREPAFVER